MKPSERRVLEHRRNQQLGAVWLAHVGVGACQARHPRELLHRCRELKPDLVLLQVALSLRDHNACVADVMAYAPTPILMVAGPGEGPGQAFSALASGVSQSAVAIPIRSS